MWFGNAAKGIGHLDPHTGHVTLFPVADEKAIVFSMAHDTKGHIWFTEISQGKLGMFDPTTNKVTELQVPTPPGTSAWLYAIVVLHNNDVWLVNGRANALVRYSPDRAAYTIFQLSTEPYGLTIDSAGTLWFTATGSPSIIGKIMP